ncbi:MAG TPA: hypothetical protein VNX01_08235 [Bacteroidia bacterium]|jgi:hypothetical protein|nr:hypothetical protein [Bacteroidia bacterium]
MNFGKKHIFWILLIFFGIAAEPLLAQNFTETPEHKKMWRKFGRKKHRDAFNPNVDSKTNKPTHEISRRLAAEDKKYIKKATKDAKRQMRKSKRKVGAK